jgi:hypothetical protein
VMPDAASLSGEAASTSAYTCRIDGFAHTPKRALL